MKLAIVVGGGSCPGIAPLIYYLEQAIVVQGKQSQTTFSYFRGWSGLINSQVQQLTPNFQYIEFGGSPIGTSRFNPSDVDVLGIESVLANYDGLVAIGGNDTLSVLPRLEHYFGARIGIPKTLDNDLCGTDYTLGHWSVVQNIVQAITRARTSTSDHGRFLVIETIGKNAGHVALRAGLLSGANFIAVPEFKVGLNEILVAVRNYPTGLVVVTSAAEIDKLTLHTPSITKGDGFNNPHYEDRGIGKALAQAIGDAHEFDARCEVLTDSVRGGPACAYDLYLAQLFAKEVASGLTMRPEEQCFMVAIKDGVSMRVDIDEAIIQKKVTRQEYLLK